MYRIFLICLLLSTALLASCGKENEEEKITSTINGSLGDVYVTADAFAEFPVTIKSHDSKYGSPVYAYEENKPPLDALVSAGLLEVQTKKNPIKVRDLSNPYKKIFKDLTVIESTYTLTETGQKSYGKKESAYIKNGFKWGKKQVASIENIEEPQQVMGRLVSEVHYLYTVTNPASWIYQVPLEIFPQSKNDVNATKAPVKDSVSLVKTNNGWVDSKKLRGSND